MSNKEFFGYPSPYPNGYSEFGAYLNDVLPDEFQAYNQIVAFPGKHELNQEVILELVNLSARTFAGRMRQYGQVLRGLTCDNVELMEIFKNRMSKKVK